jgi:hypothetical protein
MQLAGVATCIVAYPAAMTFGMLRNSALRGAFMPPDRWFAVGTADASADDAGVRAADAALIHDGAKLLIVFCSPTENLPDLIGQIRSRSGDVPMIGCTTAGEIARYGPRDGSVVVAALGGDGFVIGTAAAAGASADLRGAGARAAHCLPSAAGHPHRVVLLLTDGLASDQDEIIRGAYSVLGAGVPMVGGCAGDGLKMTRTFQFHGNARDRQQPEPGRQPRQPAGA